MKILAMKLITGEDILAQVKEDLDKVYVLESPVSIAIIRGDRGQPSVGFAPFPMHADPKPGSIINIKKEHVIYAYEPAEDFINNYNQVFGSGIVVPSKKLLVD